MNFKIKKIFFFCVVALALSSSLSSCTKGPDYIGFYNAIATLKPLKGQSVPFFFQQDDHTAVVLSNTKQFSYSGTDEIRTYISYFLIKTEKVTDFPYPGITDVWTADLSAIDQIYTKELALSQGTKEQDIETYGNSGIDLLCDENIFPSTVVEDGYLTLAFQIDDSFQTSHVINVVKGTDPENQYKLVVRHKELLANGDEFTPFANFCLFNFPLLSLPDTGGHPRIITLEWTDIDGGIHTKDFEYFTRTN